MRNGFFLLLTAVISFSLQSFAGETLHFKSGPIDLQKSQLSILANQQSRNAILKGQIIPKIFHIVQFASPLTVQQQAKVKAIGVKLLRYIPDDGYIVKANERQINELIHSGITLRAHAPYSPKFRLSDQLQTLSVFQRNQSAKMQVYMFPDTDPAFVVSELQKNGAEILSSNNRLITIKANLAVIPQITAIDGVEWVQEKHKFEKFDFYPNITNSNSSRPQFRGDYTDLSGHESGIAIMGFPHAWLTGLSGDQQLVVAADTGLDTGEMESLSKDFSNLHFLEIYGVSMDTWADSVGHGTHVLGSVGSTGESSGGVISGGAFRAALGMQNMWSDAHNGLTVPDDIRVLFSQAYKAGSRIHTNSWGSSSPLSAGRYDGDAYMVDEFSWEHPDMLILFAAGNDGADLDRDGRIDPGSVSPPATAKNTLSVGASENYVLVGGVQEQLGKLNSREWGVEPIASDLISNNPNGLVAFSARGPTTDGRIKPDLVAPGSNILSNYSQVPQAGELWGRYNDKHCFCGGTSMSTPLVAGAAALVRQYLMSIAGINNPSSSLVKAVLMHTAFDMYPGQFGEIGQANGQEILYPGPNMDQGYGRVDVARAVTQRFLMVDEAIGVATGESKEYTVPIAVGKVTLVYTDYPGSMSSSKALVNDLKIQIIADGQVYENPSYLDNSEQVVLPRAMSDVRIVVMGENVPMGRDGRQPFSLVISED